MYQVKFRDVNDRWHFFGSSFLTIVFFAILLATTGKSEVESFALAWALSFACGLWMEILTQYTRPADDPAWNKLPRWMKRVFSGHPWDHRDIELNALGALVFYPFIIALGSLFQKRYTAFLKKQKTPDGVKCLMCGRTKLPTYNRNWLSINMGKKVFYVCPIDFPPTLDDREKNEKFAQITKKINQVLKENNQRA